MFNLGDSISLFKRLLNLGLRALTLVSKFVLIFILAKFLGAAEVGLYGLIAATIGYCLFAIGLEFYTYSMRELIASPLDEQSAILRDQVVFYFFAYVFFLPLLILLFIGGTLPWGQVGWFYVILVLEHVAQELNRVLVALSLQLQASVVLFIRSGAWGLVLIPVLMAVPEFRELSVVFAAWSIGVFSACMLGIWWSIRRFSWSELPPVNWMWIKKGVKIALPLLIASLAVRGLFTFDRYWVDSIGGLHVLGAYVLYAGIGSAVISFLDAGVVVFFYQRLVMTARENDLLGFKAEMKKLRTNVLLATGLLTVLALGAGFLVVQWLNKPVYEENYHLLVWILAAMLVYGISHIPHLGLYAHGKDKVLMLSQLAALAAFFFITFVSKSVLGVMAVPVALFLTFVFMLVWKAIAYNRLLSELSSTI